MEKFRKEKTGKRTSSDMEIPKLVVFTEPLTERREDSWMKIMSREREGEISLMG